MKIRVNTRRIAKLNPCRDRFENWKQIYPDWEGDITEFLRLEGITPQDKVWVAVRLMPRFLVEVFAIDCDMNAAYATDAATIAYSAAASAAYATDAATTATIAYSAAASAAYATDAATYAAYATDATATDAAAERQRQVEALLHLISTTTRKECKALS